MRCKARAPPEETRRTMPAREQVIFEYSRPGRGARDQWPQEAPPAALSDLPAGLRRSRPPALPEVGELETVRHFTRLSQLNYSIDTNFYPLGSCTMKYNPKVNEALALEPALAGAHPMAPEQAVQGTLELLHGLERGLSELCGMDAFTLQPAAGAHGELVGVLLTRAYHNSRGD